MEKELQERENSKHEMKTRPKKFALLQLFDFKFPALEVPHSYFKKAVISKLILAFSTLSYSTLFVCNQDT